MAITVEGARLTEAHRVAQARNAAAVALLVKRYFGVVVDARRLSVTSEAWLAAVLPVILRGRVTSANLAASYASNFRVLEGVEPLNTQRFPAILDKTPEEAIRRSLIVTGPVALQRQMRLISGRALTPLQETQLEKAMTSAATTAGGSAMRHTLNASRDTIVNATVEDKKALGYVRVTKDDPCYFCAMLASRGPVYEKDSFDESDPRFTGFGDFKVHDSCACSLEPTYSRSSPWPGRSREFADRWAQLPRPTLLEWRRQYEGRATL